MYVVGDVFFERTEYKTGRILAAHMSRIFVHSSALLSLLLFRHYMHTEGAP